MTAQVDALILFTQWARLNPQIDDPTTLLRVWRAYRRMARRDLKAGA